MPVDPDDPQIIRLLGSGMQEARTWGNALKLASKSSDDDHRQLGIEYREVLRVRGERLGDHLLDSVVITTGQHAYRRADGVAVVPAALLGA